MQRDPAPALRGPARDRADCGSFAGPPRPPQTGRLRRSGGAPGLHLPDMLRRGLDVAILEQHVGFELEPAHFDRSAVIDTMATESSPKFSNGTLRPISPGEISRRSERYDTIQDSMVIACMP